MTLNAAISTYYFSRIFPYSNEVNKTEYLEPKAANTRQRFNKTWT